MSYDFDQQPQGLSDGAKIAIGCGAAAFVCVALICGGTVMVGFRAMDVAKEAVQEAMDQARKQRAMMEQEAEEFAERYVDEGYQRVDAEFVNVESIIQQSTVYTGQSLNLHADSEASIAAAAQVIDVNGTINGDLHVRCNVLNIHEDTVITGNLYIEEAFVVENEGTVQGEVVRGAPPTDEAIEADDADLPEPDLKPSPGDVIEKPGKTENDSSQEASGESPGETANETQSST